MKIVSSLTSCHSRTPSAVGRARSVTGTTRRRQSEGGLGDCGMMRRKTNSTTNLGMLWTWSETKNNQVFNIQYATNFLKMAITILDLNVMYVSLWQLTKFYVERKLMHFVITGWPRNNATLTINNFKKTRDRMKKVVCIIAYKILFPARWHQDH